MHLDNSHPIVGELQRLLPEGVVAGGSFSSWLPSPGSLPRTERAHRLAQVQKTATEQCLRDLLDAAGLGNGPVPPREPDGQRGWPPGYVGSVSHKNTLVLATLAKASNLASIGIDVERIEPSDERLGHILTPEERRPRGFSQLQSLALTFSAKEAVFKAQFPTTGRTLSFEDVFIHWNDPNGSSIRGVARCGSAHPLEVRCTLSAKWVVCVALENAFDFRTSSS